MISASELVHFSRLLVELRDSAEYLPAAASELQGLLECDDVVWTDADFPSGQFTVWRASVNARDGDAERAMPPQLHHPAVETYLRDPANLTPRRDSDVAELAGPQHREAVRLSEETIGRYKLSMVTHVDPIGVGRAWIVIRSRREFDGEHLDVASHLLPILLALDRLHRSRADGAPLPHLPDRPGWAALSVRERQVVDLLAAGLKGPAIGRMLGISPRTVGKHLEHVYRKLGRHDRLLVAQSVPWRREVMPAPMTDPVVRSILTRGG